MGATVLLRVPDGFEDFAEQFPGVDRVLERGTTRVGFRLLPERRQPAARIRHRPCRGARRRSLSPRRSGARLPVEIAVAARQLTERWRRLGRQSQSRRRPSLDAAVGTGAFGCGREVQFLSLQKGARGRGKDATAGIGTGESRARSRRFPRYCGGDRQLDLVLCVDTSVAHLAGAMGKPVWLMLPKPAEWRWMEGGTTVHGIRRCGCSGKSREGEWGDVIGRVGWRCRRSARAESIAALASGATANVQSRRDTSRCRSGFSAWRRRDRAFSNTCRTIRRRVNHSLVWRGVAAPAGPCCERVRPGATVVEVGAGVGAHAIRHCARPSARTVTCS